MEVLNGPRGWGKRYATFFDLRTATMFGRHQHVLEPGVAWCNAKKTCKGARAYVPQKGSPLPVRESGQRGTAG